MALSTADINKIAHLARIEVSTSDASATLSKLSGILSLIEQMQGVDTSGIAPMSHAQELSQRLRDDVVTKTNLRDEFQKNAPVLGNGSALPAVAMGLYLVPQVIE
jgi:aspartyl-tRNA(Asn)/glutamyl-tRNA(Gln) amidotransferase subunit C